MLDRGSRFDRNYTGSLPMFPRESYGQVAAIADDERNHNLSLAFWPWGCIFGQAMTLNLCATATIKRTPPSAYGLSWLAVCIKSVGGVPLVGVRV